jgi:hypothetical protein
VAFRNKFSFYDEELLALRPELKKCVASHGGTSRK